MRNKIRKLDRNTLTFLLIILMIAVAGSVYAVYIASKEDSARNFDECVAKGNPVAESHPRQCIDAGKTFVEIIGQEISVSGEIVCLPHKDQGEAQTLECAVGLKTDDSRHYALRGAQAGQIEVGDKLHISGRLSKSDPANIYDIEGVIDVTKID